MRSLTGTLLVALVLSACGEGGTSGVCDGLSASECETPDAGAPDGGEPDGGEPSDAGVIVDVAWLQEHVDDSDVQLIDTRSVGYSESRIGDAMRLVPGDLSATIDGVGGQLVPAEDAEPVLRAAGLREGVTAVVYGTSPEYDPARIVWALRYYGHADVRYLDGGFDAWVAAGGALVTTAPEVPATDYTIDGIDESLRVTGDWVLQELGDAPYDDPAIQLVDARSAGEYDWGHIPSATHVNWTDNLVSGFLRPTAELAALYANLDSAETTVAYCGSGQRGSFAWLSLVALGYDDARLYDGSWNEWGNGSFPVEP